MAGEFDYLRKLNAQIYQAAQTPPDAEERRTLRYNALHDAVLLHGEPDLIFDPEETMIKVLRTAEEFYQWIIKEEDD